MASDEVVRANSSTNNNHAVPFQLHLVPIRAVTNEDMGVGHDATQREAADIQQRRVGREKNATLVLVQANSGVALELLSEKPGTYDTGQQGPGQSP